MMPRYLYTVTVMARKRQTEDITVKIDVPFDEAIRRLSHAKHEDSPAEESGSTKSGASPKPARTAKRSACANCVILLFHKQKQRRQP